MYLKLHTHHQFKGSLFGIFIIKIALIKGTQVHLSLRVFQELGGKFTCTERAFINFSLNFFILRYIHHFTKHTLFLKFNSTSFKCLHTGTVWILLFFFSFSPYTWKKIDLQIKHCMFQLLNLDIPNNFSVLTLRFVYCVSASKLKHTERAFTNMLQEKARKSQCSERAATIFFVEFL